MDPNHPKRAPFFIRWLVKRFKIDVNAVARARAKGASGHEIYKQSIKDEGEKLSGQLHELKEEIIAPKEISNAEVKKVGGAGVKKQAEEGEDNAWTKLIQGVAPPEGSTEYKQKEFKKVLSPAGQSGGYVSPVTRCGRGASEKEGVAR